jgi:hypothetical protein
VRAGGIRDVFPVVMIARVRAMDEEMKSKLVSGCSARNLACYSACSGAGSTCMKVREVKVRECKYDFDFREKIFRCE